MYSPKIKEIFIPQLYQLKRKTNKPMTHLVNEAVQQYLRRSNDEPKGNPENSGENSIAGDQSPVQRINKKEETQINKGSDWSGRR